MTTGNTRAGRGLLAAVTLLGSLVATGSAQAQTDELSTITIVQQIEPDTGLDFKFGGGLGQFLLDDPGTDDGDDVTNSQTFTVAEGPLRIRQQVFRNFPLDEIACSATVNEAVVDTTKHLLILDVEAGEDITCTFANTKTSSSRSRITIVQDTTPGDPIDFRYSSSLGRFQLDDPDIDDADVTRRTRSFVVASGTYRFEQQRYNGWPLVDIECDRSGPVQRRDGGVILIYASDLTITCTFRNASRTESSGALSARVLHDVDGDGRDQPEAGDSWLPGWTVQAIDTFGTITESVTDDAGRATFDLPPGDYTVCDVLMDGWYRSAGRTGCLHATVRPDTTTWTRFAVWDVLAANGPSSRAAASHDGTQIAFSSSASNLVADDDNDMVDVFVRDTTTGTTRLISRSPDGAPANGHSLDSAISGDGARIAFISSADDLVADDTNRQDDVFLYDSTTESITRINVADDGTQSAGGASEVAISSDGNTVGYATRANDIVAGDADDDVDVLLYDVVTRSTIRVNGGNSGRTVATPDISADGSKVVYLDGDIWLYDVDSGTRTLIAEWNATNPSISGDGTRIAFESSDDTLVPDDTNRRRDTFVHDTTTGETVRVSLRSNGLQGNGDSNRPEISTDGRHVTFTSYASNLVVGDRNSRPDLFVHDLDTCTTTRVSVDSDGVETDRPSYGASPSGNGARVVFSTDATTLAPGNGVSNVYVHDVATATTTLVSTALR